MSWNLLLAKNKNYSTNLNLLEHDYIIIKNDNNKCFSLELLHNLSYILILERSSENSISHTLEEPTH